MPNIKSAIKALRQNKRRKEMNLVYLNAMRTLSRDLKKQVVAGQIKEAKESVKKLYKVLDKAAKHGTIKKNTASRKKSRFTKMVNKANKK